MLLCLINCHFIIIIIIFIIIIIIINVSAFIYGIIKQKSHKAPQTSAEQMRF